jgi:hypothetical protein
VVKGSSFDPSAFGSAVAMAGANVDLGRLGRELGKGPFAKRGRDLERRAEQCPALALATMSTGGWLGLLGVVLTEAKREKELAPIAAGLRNGIIAVRKLPNRRAPRGQREGSMAAHFVLSSGGLLRAKLEGAVAKGKATKSSFAFGGAKTTVYRDKRGREDFVVGITDLGGGGTAVTIAPRNRVEDIGWLLRKNRAAKGTSSSPELAYGHVNIPAILQQVAASLPRMAREMLGAPLRAFGDRVGRLRGQLSLQGNRLVADVKLGRK